MSCVSELVKEAIGVVKCVEVANKQATIKSKEGVDVFVALFSCLSYCMFILSPVGQATVGILLVIVR